MIDCYHNIRILLFAHRLHPFASRLLDVVESESSPQVFRQPCRDCRRKKTNYRHLHAVAVENRVGWKIRFSRSRVDNVCAENRKIALADPTVVDRMASLHVVVSHVTRIVAQIVHHRRRHKGCSRVEEIVVVYGRLSLQNVAVVEQQQVVTEAFALTFHVG